MSTQASQDNFLPIVVNTPKQQNSTLENSPSRLAQAIGGIGLQHQQQATTMLRPVSTNTLIFDGHNEKFQVFEDFFHTMPWMQPELTEVIKITHFYVNSQKEALEKFKSIIAVNRKTLVGALTVFRSEYLKPESQITATQNWQKQDPYSIS